MASKAKSEKYLSSADICERYGITRRTLCNWMKANADFPPFVTINRRDYWSEYDIEKWESARGGRDPDMGSRLVGLSPVSGVISDYAEFVEAMVKRRKELGITSMELDDRSGMQEGYTSKLENYGRPQSRGMGPEIFPLWLGGLKLGVVLVEMPRKRRKARNA